MRRRGVLSFAGPRVVSFYPDEGLAIEDDGTERAMTEEEVGKIFEYDERQRLARYGRILAAWQRGAYG